MLPRHIIEQVAGMLSLSTAATWQVIGGGDVNRVYRVSDNGSTFVVKWMADDCHTGVDKAYQFSLQQQLADCGIAPEPIGLSDDSQVWIERWHESHTTTNVDLAQLASVLAAIHSVAVHARPLGLAARWRHHLKVAQLSSHHKWHLEAEKLIALHHLDDHENAEWVMCHNDLSVGHILDANKPVIVDWEYAARGDRYFDVVSCAGINGLSDSDAMALFSLYAQSAGLSQQHVIERCLAQQAVVTLTAELWQAAVNAR